MTGLFDVSPFVAAALKDKRPVVALETTLVTHGLPHPEGVQAAAKLEAEVVAAGAVPATVGVLDGRVRVGLSAAELERLATAPDTAKLNLSNLAAQIAAARPGSTTVAATLAVAAWTGIQVFATGGIGGVHRDSDVSGDVSADLGAIARHAVVTTCAGAKAFLDLPKTVELLDTLGVPLLGWRHDWFPAFYSRSSGVTVQHRVESAADVAAIFRHRPDPSTGVLLTAPIPTSDELDAAVLDQAIADALAACAAADVRGAAVTPFLLEPLEAATGGTSVRANLALAEHNASVAAEVAVALA